MSLRKQVYLDSNAEAPLRKEVLEALLSLFQSYSIIPNPSSIHRHGQLAKKWISEARESIARSLGQGVDPEQIVFTSSGTEANQLAIRSALEPFIARGEEPVWITTPVEHDSNMQMIKWAQARGVDVVFLPVDQNGKPDVESIEQYRARKPRLVSLLWVNNETGVVSDVHRAITIARSMDALIHIDAAQAWGKVPADLARLNAHYVTFSAHKIGALAGTGFVWVNRGVPVHPILLGKQEKGRRGGTENTVGIYAAGIAAKYINPQQFQEQLAPLRDRLQSVICEQIPGTWVNGGSAENRVANTLNLSFEGVEGDGLVMAMDLAGYSVSSGSACSSGVLEPSHVLRAMGRTPAQAMAALRISLSEPIEWSVLEGFVVELKKIIERVRKGEKWNLKKS